MKTFLKVIFTLVLVVAMLVAIALGGVEWYLHSDSFKQLVRQGTREVRGVTLDDFEVSLFRGVTLKGIAATNLPDAQGLSFAADSLSVRHRIMPLFRKRAELAEIALEHPVVTLPMAAATTAASNTNRLDMPPELQRSGWEFVLDKFTVRNGDITFLNASNKPALHLTDFNLDALPPQSSGTLTATLANGPVTGSFTKRDSRWQFQADARDADVPVLFRQAGLPSVLKGKMQATIALEGGDSLTGQGRLQITGGSTSGMPLMGLLALLLQTPALRDVQLDECRMEFTIATNQLHTPVIRMISQQIELTGHGTASLADGSLNHDLSLVLAPEIYDRAPNWIRKLFKEQPNGRRVLNFHVSGTYAAPKLDIEERAVQQATDKAAGVLQKLLR